MKTSFQSWLCPWRVFCETVGLWELKSVWILWETSTNQPLINFSKPSVQNSEEEKGTWNSTSVLLSFLCLTRQLTIPTLWAVLEGKIGQCMVESASHWDPVCGCCDGGALNWPSLPQLWFCFPFFCFLKKYAFQRVYWKLNYMLLSFLVVYPLSIL